MKYLVVEEFPEGQFNVIDTYDSLDKAIRAEKKLQKGYLFPLNKKNNVYEREDLIYILRMIYQSMANHFGFTLEKYFKSQKKECTVSRHLVRYEFIDRFRIENKEDYRRMEQEISGISNLNHTTIKNSLEHAHTARVHPDPLHKTIYLILRSYL